jgi:plastocyanin
MTMRRVLVLLLAGLLLAGCSDGRGALVVSDPDAVEADYEYLIPAGTAERITAGETVEILPAQLAVHVGEVIRIVNDDSAGHFVGIFYVGPGEIVTQRFASPGDFSGLCTIHPSGQITLTVSE